MSLSEAPDTATARPVLLLFAESLAAIEVSWSLLDAGFEVIAVTRQERRPALSRSRSIRVVSISSPERDLGRATRDLCALLEASQPAAVMPLEDAALHVCGGAQQQVEVRIAGPTGDQAVLALDKRRQITAAERSGLDVPSTRHFESPRDALCVSEFPVVLKAGWAVMERSGRLERQAPSICGDRQELERAVAGWPEQQPLLAQALIEGTGEGIFGLVSDGRVSAWSAHRRVRMVNPRGSGSSACVSQDVDLELVGPIESMLAKAGWDGIFMAEFLRDSAGRPWFMELNGRAWGSTALARRMGFEYPAWEVRHALDPGFVPALPSPRPPVLCRHAGRELVHLAVVLRGPKSRALTSWPSRGQTAREVLSVRRGDRLYNWRPGELPVFVSDTVQTVSGKLLPRRRKGR